MNIDVFISHSSKDRKIANVICNTLEANNIKCWLAPRDIRPGSDWAETINSAIENSKIMVLVFSENANNSIQVAKELNLAINNKLMVVPFKVDASTPTGSMKYYLSDTQWLDAVNGDIKEEIERLKDALIYVLPQETSDIENEDDTTSVQATENNTSQEVGDDSLVDYIMTQQNIEDGEASNAENKDNTASVQASEENISREVSDDSMADDVIIQQNIEDSETDENEMSRMIIAICIFIFAIIIINILGVQDYLL